MQIRVLVPVLHSAELVDKAREEYCAAAAPGTEISVACLANGTRTIESDFDIALAGPETVRLAREAEAERIDACTIACFSDPGMSGARELVRIPVIGEGLAALTTASLLGGRMVVITTWNQCIPRIRRLVERNGFAQRLAAVKAVNLGVMDMNESCVPRIVELTVQAVLEDDAQVVVLGCTGTGFDMATAVEQALRERLSTYVPVIDPVKAAVKLAEACVSAGVSHSKVAWANPPQGRDEYCFASTRAAE